jgi:hypothetical protein
MKIMIKYLKNSEESTNMNSSKFSINLFRNSSNRYCDITYNFQEENQKELDILFLKIYISKTLKIEKENISIFSCTSESINNTRGLPDNLNIIESKDNLSLFVNKELKTFYYKINSGVALVNLIVEIDIDNNKRDLNLSISGNCSIYMLKYNLSEGLSISKNNIELKNEKNNNIYNDEQFLSDVYSEFINYLEDINDVNSCSSEDDNSFHNQENNQPVFKIILIQKLLKTKSKGINFFFNYMNEINKFRFQDIAPEYREASDGINIIFYCNNLKCKIYNDMFIYKLGKKLFNI